MTQPKQEIRRRAYDDKLVIWEQRPVDWDVEPNHIHPQGGTVTTQEWVIVAVHPAPFSSSLSKEKESALHSQQAITCVPRDMQR